MEEKELQMLIDLTDARGVPGNEREVREVFRRYAEPFAESFSQDGLGGLFAKHVGTEDGPTILLAGHLDEVGFMVTSITEKGFIKFQTLGGWWNQVMLAQQVEITNSKGVRYHGVIGCKPPHVLTAEARKKPYEIKDMFIDIGASSKEQAAEWGIKPGDMITPYISFKRMNDSKFLLAKAWDNRIGLAVALKVLENVAEGGHPNVIFSGGNAQEEVGLRGAKTATHMIRPDIAFALDTGTAGDTPGMTPQEADSELGKGPQLLIYDASMIPHRGLRDFIVGVAEECGIPFQYTVITGGGTDAGAQHQSLDGIPSFAITVPVRYLHSHTSMIHEDDYLNTVKLVTELLKRLNAETVNRICENV